MNYNIPLSVSNKRMLIRNYATSNNNIFICNVDISGNIINNSNTFKVYLWAINNSKLNQLKMKIYGCAIGQLCNSDSHFTQVITGGQTYDSYSLNKEVLELSKVSATSASVSVNGQTVFNTLTIGCYCSICNQQIVP